MSDSQPLLDFNPDFCRKIAKRGAIISFAWLGIAICILALVHPGSQCPAWTIYDKNGEATSLWVIVGFFMGLPTILLCFIVMRWKGFTRMINDSGADSYRRFLASKGSDYQNKPAAYTFPMNSVFVMAIGMWSLFCSIPLWAMILPCF
ncbi:hypothetical protein [Bradyrhizobium sp. 2S1]|uniref:hypothetical protein n=1 Tax=Bradyrhizobium sp. 2S1 TaxID=1404429 RepID=UPI001408DFE6|nr:hypothetical protein [Bradyrhizobium sp. 2S1]MCK7668614.1 hypothetical protein [Bradyrhizobium sp. 2S1]